MIPLICLKNFENWIFPGHLKKLFVKKSENIPQSHKLENNLKTSTMFKVSYLEKLRSDLTTTTETTTATTTTTTTTTTATTTVTTATT